jgi:hypothetical protein
MTSLREAELSTTSLREAELSMTSLRGGVVDDEPRDVPRHPDARRR